MTARQLWLRIGQALLVLLATYTLAFVLLAALPSDAIMARYASPDLGLSSDEINAIRAEYGADKPLIAQYFTSLFGFLTGNFGYSVQTGSSIASMVSEALPGTLALAIAAFRVCGPARSKSLPGRDEKSTSFSTCDINPCCASAASLAL